MGGNLFGEVQMNEIVMIDYETGGLDFAHPNIQLAAVALDEQWREVDSFESKIKFDPAVCEPKALEVNRYDAKAWAGAPSSDEVFGKFCGWLKKHATMEMTSKRTGSKYKVARLAAFNAPFDKDRLWQMADGQFVPAHPQMFCAMQLAMWSSLQGMFDADSFKLTDVAKGLGLPFGDAHDALTDVRIASAVVREIFRRRNGSPL